MCRPTISDKDRGLMLVEEAGFPASTLHCMGGVAAFSYLSAKN